MKTPSDYEYQVRVDRIISAFFNPVNWAKVDDYAERMTCGETPPPILGYPTTIDENDVGERFLSGEFIEEEHIGESAWYVTDGHHRSCAALQAGLWNLDAERDSATFATWAELEEYQAVMSVSYGATVSAYSVGESQAKKYSEQRFL